MIAFSTGAVRSVKETLNSQFVENCKGVIQRLTLQEHKMVWNRTTHLWCVSSGYSPLAGPSLTLPVWRLGLGWLFLQLWGEVAELPLYTPTAAVWTSLRAHEATSYPESTEAVGPPICRSVTLGFPSFVPAH